MAGVRDCGCEPLGNQLVAQGDLHLEFLPNLIPEDIIEILREATSRGVIIINISQCPRGEVAATYAVR